MPINLPSQIPLPAYLILKAVMCIIPSIIFSFIIGILLYFLNRSGIIQYFQDIMQEVRERQENKKPKEGE